jgi:GTPase SAR1 family protein
LAFTESELQGMSENYSSPYLFTSAKTGENVEKAFLEISSTIVKKKVGST